MNIKKDIKELLKQNKNKNHPFKELKFQKRAIKNYYLKHKKTLFKNQFDVLKRYKHLYKKTNSNPANTRSIILSVISGIVASYIYNVIIGNKSEPGILTIFIPMLKEFQLNLNNLSLLQKLLGILIVAVLFIVVIIIIILISLFFINAIIQVFKIDKFENILVEYELSIIKKTFLK